MKTLPPLRDLDRLSPDELGMLMFDHMDSPENIKVLLEMGANDNLMERAYLKIPMYSRGSILHVAAADGYLDACKLLVSHGLDVNVENTFNQTPLHLAAYTGQLEIAKFLVEQHIMINLQNEWGETALHSAAWNGYLEICRLLVSSGGDITMKNHLGQTPWDKAQTVIKESLPELKP